MASKRNYKVKGTKDFLVLAGIFFFLGIWAIKDAWYPSPGVLEKHPQEVVAAFTMDGTVAKVLVSEGDMVAEEQVVATLRDDTIKKAFEAAKIEYTAAKKEHSKMDAAVRNASRSGASAEELATMQLSLAEAKGAMDEALEKVNAERANLDSTELLSPAKGHVLKITSTAHTMVKAGDEVAVIHPDDHFYLFNKSLAIISFIAFWVFMGIHILAR